MKEKSHRAPRRCYRSGVWTLNGTQTWRLDGHSLDSPPALPGPRDFEADHRHIRPAAGQFRRRRHSAEADRRPARPDLAIGRRHPRPSATRQGGAPASGFAAPARLRAGLWLRRLQRRRPADRRPDPQAAARPRSARRRGLGIAAHAVAVRKRRGPRRPLSARDGVGRRRADLPPRAPGRRGPAHHDRSRCDGRPDARSAGVCLFNGYYDTWCYLPLVATVTFNREPIQHVVAALLRPGTGAGTRGVRGLLRRLFSKLRALFPRARLRVRADAGFADATLLALFDAGAVESA